MEKSLKRNWVKVIISLLLIVIIAIVIVNNRVVYKDCLESWTYEWNNSLINNYHLTKEDFCKKGYTLSDFLKITEDFTRQIIKEEGYTKNTFNVQEKIKDRLKIKYEKLIK